MEKLALQSLGNIFRRVISMEKDLLKKLISIESYSGNEKEIINYIKEFFDENQIKSSIDPVGNIIAEIGTGSSCLILSSHVDTISEPIKFREEGEKIYGRGAVDDKGTTAAMILSLLKYKNKNLKKKIQYIGIVAEENSLKGMKSLIKSKIKADAAIFGEPTNNKIAVAYKGRLLYEISIINPEGPKHSAHLNNDKNPIILAYKVWEEINETLINEYHGKTPFFSVIPNLTVIQTQNNSNVIPERCNFSIDIRIPPGINIEEIKKRIKAIFEENEEKFSIKIEFQILSEIPGYRIDNNEEIVKISKAALKIILNSDPKLLRKTGTNFMNLFGTALAIPTISIGPGDPKLEHTNNEYIEISQFNQAIKIYEKIIELYLEP